jgi:GTP-binding protein
MRANDSNSELLPAIALIGRPNVGKSTLFNRLTRSRDALVADVPGVTRDVNVGIGRIGKKQYLVADTGGIDGGGSPLRQRVTERALSMATECAAIVLILDGAQGINSADQVLAAEVRKLGKPVFLTINKADRFDPDMLLGECYELGLGTAFPISALNGGGVEELVDAIGDDWPVIDRPADEKDAKRVRVAVVGRPNVGKSTLVNRMLGQERMMTADAPGTTRDSVCIDFDRAGRLYTLIDTAGLRRKARVDDKVEKFSAIKSMQAIEFANVVLVVVDAQTGIVEQDATLLGNVIASGRSLVIVVNKWDGLRSSERTTVRNAIDRKLRFAPYAAVKYVSALHGTGVGNLFAAVDAAWRSANVPLSTSAANEILQRAVAAHPPPLVRGRRIKLRYAHLGAKNPPTIIVHGNQTESVPPPYRRYLANYFRESLNLVGTPVRIEFRHGDNPFKNRRNELSPRQQRRRQRLLRHARRGR